jgi:CDP-ribitol ribitolphosphotransferase / teichoic acid ribitol-phosphate polymerase
MKKTFGYCLFALVYNMCRIVPVKKKRVFCIMTHDEGEGSNVAIVVRALKKASQDYSFSYLLKSDTTAAKSLSGAGTLLRFFFRKPYELARAEIILLDNIFLPFAYLKRRKGTKVVQLWHGTGTIKKFGQDVNTGHLKELERRANENITHLIVNSPDIKSIYASAFGVKEESIYPIGLPKTDELLRRIKSEEAAGRYTNKEYIYQKYSIPKEKKLILYAPTFRDTLSQNPRFLELIRELNEQLSEEFYFGLRLHPFIANSFRADELGENICQLSFEKDVNTVLLAADILITDYSSIIFEFCLMERPMIFYAFDYQEFSDHGRGFYYEYPSFVPGPVAYTGDEVVRIIKEDAFELYRIKDFIHRNYIYTDGNATERLIELLK